MQEPVESESTVEKHVKTVKEGEADAHAVERQHQGRSSSPICTLTRVSHCLTLFPEVNFAFAESK